jgi:dolichol-phosphate mannosyltransferase
MNTSLKHFDGQSKNILKYLSHPLHKQQKVQRYEHALKMVELAKNEDVLEIGCGVGYQIPGIIEKCKNYLGLDFSKKSLKFCKKTENNNLIVADAQEVPFKKNTFDVILMIDVLHNLYDPKNALKEARRVLKDYGKIVVSVPNKYSFYGLTKFLLKKINKWKYEIVPPVDNWFTYESIKLLLKNNEFEIKNVKGSYFLLPLFDGNHYLVPRISIIPKIYDIFERTLSKCLVFFGYHIIIFCTKPLNFHPKQVSIILPTYNERDNIKEVIDNVLKNLPHSEIIVVDDNSPDKTWKLVKQMCKKNKKIRLYRRFKRDLGSAINDGIILSRGDAVVWMDCNLSHHPNILPILIKELKNNDIVIASRHVKKARDKRPFIRVFLTSITNFFAYILLGGIKDYTAGFVVVRRGVFEKLKIPESKHGEYFIDFIYSAKKKGFKIKEIPFFQLPRKRGKSKFSIKDSIYYFFTIIKLRLGKCQSIR